MCLAKPFRTCSSFHSAFALTQRATQPSLPPAFESSRADQFMELKIYRQRIKYYLNDFAWIKFISVSLTKLFLSLTRQYLPFSEKTDQLGEKSFSKLSTYHYLLENSAETIAPLPTFPMQITHLRLFIGNIKVKLLWRKPQRFPARLKLCS